MKSDLFSSGVLLVLLEKAIGQDLGSLIQRQVHLHQHTVWAMAHKFGNVYLQVYVSGQVISDYVKSATAERVNTEGCGGGGFGESQGIRFSSKGLSNDSQPCQKSNISSQWSQGCLSFWLSCQSHIAEFDPSAVSLLPSPGQPLPTTLVKPEALQDSEKVQVIPCSPRQCSRSRLRIRSSFRLRAVPCCNARWAEQMGRGCGRLRLTAALQL